MSHLEVRISEVSYEASNIKTFLGEKLPILPTSKTPSVEDNQTIGGLIRTVARVVLRSNVVFKNSAGDVLCCSSANVSYFSARQGEPKGVFHDWYAKVV